MMFYGLLKAVAAVAITTGILVGAASCTTKGFEMDAAGMTQSEVMQQPLEQQFNAMAKRYARMQELLEEAQLQVTDANTPWIWISSGIAPDGGDFAPTALAGATGENSYFMQAIRAIRLPGATGAQEDLDPMVAFFEKLGGEVETSGDTEHGWTAKTVTSDGYRMSYQVQPNGQYNLDVVSNAFWGDTRGLLHAIVDRIPEEDSGREASLPGVFDVFPDWNAPTQQ